MKKDNYLLTEQRCNCENCKVNKQKKVVFSSLPPSLYLTLAINTRDWSKLEIISLREEDKRYKLFSDFISL